jgi:hypothetical protein
MVLGGFFLSGGWGSTEDPKIRKGWAFFGVFSWESVFQRSSLWVPTSPRPHKQRVFYAFHMEHALKQRCIGPFRSGFHTPYGVEPGTPGTEKMEQKAAP